MVRTIYVYSYDDKEKVYQNCKFHDPRGRGSCAQAWSCKSFSEAHYFLIKFFSLLRVMVQSNYVKRHDEQARVYQTCVL